MEAVGRGIGRRHLVAARTAAALGGRLRAARRLAIEDLLPLAAGPRPDVGEVLDAVLVDPRVDVGSRRAEPDDEQQESQPHDKIVPWPSARGKASIVAVMLARLAALLVVAACGDNRVEHFVGLVQVSGKTSFAAGCNGAPQSGTVSPSSEVEPWLAVDPHEPAHLVATWQQDRWSNGGANGNLVAASFDGGDSWVTAAPAFGRCSGGNYERTSDPWVTIAPDGVAYASAIGFDGTTARSAVLASRSVDGVTWEAPAVLIDDNDPDVFNDKDSIASDALHVYAVWDRITGQTHPNEPIGTGPALLARLTDGAWEPARTILDPGVDAQTIGNVIAALPDGTLVDVANVITSLSSKTPTGVVAAIRSTDHGVAWSAPVTIATLDGIGVAAGDGVPIRSGTDLVSVAADPITGALYATWEGLNVDHDGIWLARSLDGARTWSAPVLINGAPDVPAFEPTIAVAHNGAVAVFYYDLRGQTGHTARATPWLATSVDGGATWTEVALSEAFDLAPARLGDAYFLGDYQGLVAAVDHFQPLFVAPLRASDPTNVYVKP